MKKKFFINFIVIEETYFEMKSVELDKNFRKNRLTAKFIFLIIGNCN